MDKELKAYDKNNIEIKVSSFINSKYGLCKVLEVFENNKIGFKDSKENKIIEYSENCEVVKGDE